jgi:hypothetical protein
MFIFLFSAVLKMHFLDGFITNEHSALAVCVENANRGTVLCRSPILKYYYQGSPKLDFYYRQYSLARCDLSVGSQY